MTTGGRPVCLAVGERRRGPISDPAPYPGPKPGHGDDRLWPSPCLPLQPPDSTINIQGTSRVRDGGRGAGANSAVPVTFSTRRDPSRHFPPTPPPHPVLIRSSHRLSVTTAAQRGRSQQRAGAVKEDGKGRGHQASP